MRAEQSENLPLLMLFQCFHVQSSTNQPLFLLMIN